MFVQESWAQEEVEGWEMSLLRQQSRMSKRLATRAPLSDRWVRPLPLQQEEAMNSRKKLFQYHNETSADEAKSSATVSL